MTGSAGMADDHRRLFPLIVAIVAAAIGIAAWMAGTALLVVSTLDVRERIAVDEALGPRMPLLLLAWVVATGASAAGLWTLYRRYSLAALRLLDEARALVSSGAVSRPTGQGAPEIRSLAAVITALADQRDRLHDDVDVRIAQSGAALERERNRLAELMSALSRSVVVCNRDGRILLYNQQARVESLALSEVRSLAGGADLIGIGRSIYAIIDEAQILHARKHLQRQMDASEPRPSVQFVASTGSGQMLRVQMAPVRPNGDGDDAGDAGDAGDGDAGNDPGDGDAGGDRSATDSGFMLMFENVTQRVEAEAARDRFLAGLVEGSGASLAIIQAAVDALASSELEPAQRAQRASVVRAEIASLAGRVDELARRTAGETLLHLRQDGQDGQGNSSNRSAPVDTEPMIARHPAVLLPTDDRPEFYDFDLFAPSDAFRSLDDRRLGALVYTVFDTETTGLDPSAGDEIIQIGGARIVNGRLLRSESFEQLVDPERSIPPASTQVHGITAEHVAGKPRIGEVLAAFHRFAQDTVLVAHNAAFDMRFLQLKEAATGVVFEQPVVDTMLLSAVLNPAHEAHGLDAIAERFGIPVKGRHSALGDAIVTAEVLLRMIPLLEARGIRTFGALREASRKAWLARIEY